MIKLQWKRCFLKIFKEKWLNKRGHLSSTDNPCDPNPCQHDGTCVLMSTDLSPPSYECSCIFEWIGIDCDIGEYMYITVFIFLKITQILQIIKEKGWSCLSLIIHSVKIFYKSRHKYIEFRDNCIHIDTRVGLKYQNTILLLKAPLNEYNYWQCHSFLFCQFALYPNRFAIYLWLLHCHCFMHTIT